MRMQLAAPLRHTKEMQPHRCVRISEHAGNPRIRRFDLDTQFLAQLAYQRMVGRLAGFDLAAGKFPVACPDFVGGALGEEEGAIGTLQDGGGDLDYFLCSHRVGCIPCTMLFTNTLHIAYITRPIWRINPTLHMPMK